MAVAHAGRATLRAEPGWHHLTSLLLHAANAVLLFLLLQRPDRRSVAQRVGGGAVCAAPAARGIGGLGCRAQGRAQRVLFHADAAGIQPLRGSPKCEVQSAKSVVHLPSSILHPLSSFPLLLRPGADEQADAGDAALCFAAAGLLAAEKNCGVRSAECGIGGGQRALPLLRCSSCWWRKRPSLRSPPRRAW